MNIVYGVMLGIIRYMAFLDNKKLYILFPELPNSDRARYEGYPPQPRASVKIFQEYVPKATMQTFLPPPLLRLVFEK